MSNTHNLDEDVAEYFEFVLKGITYQMRYPTANEISDIANEKDTNKQMDQMYAFIEPTKEGPPIKKVIGESNVKIIQRFNKMVTDEFMGTE